jgi:hypothetical protein
MVVAYWLPSSSSHRVGRPDVLSHMQELPADQEPLL